jgi:hypothetical protein
MKSNLVITTLCLLLFAAIGQAQPISLERPPQPLQGGYQPLQAVGVPTEEVFFIMGSADNITVGLQAPGEFTVDPSNLYQNPVVPPTQEELQQQQIMEALDEQMEAASHKAMMKGMVRSIWNGQGTNLLAFAGILEDPTIATAWGISEEQMKQIEERMDSTMEQMGETM